VNGKWNFLFVQFFKKSLNKKIDAWLDRRIHSTRKAILTGKNTYILPTRQGMLFIVLMSGIFFGGVNYANSLVLSLTFFMISLFMVSMLYTYRNLVGLVIEAARTQNGFVGESAVFTVNLTRTGKRTHEAIELVWDHAMRQRVDLLATESLDVALLLPAKKRGYYHPGRLKIETRYPVGLFKAWSWLHLDMQCWNYPKPVRQMSELNQSASGEGQKMSEQPGLDDFAGLRAYIPGDSLKQVDWKTLARSNELHTKTFVAAVDQDVWLDWKNFSSLTVEARLSALCYDILFWSKQNRPFGLRLPGFEKKPGYGPVHQQQCLEALARYRG